MSYPVMEMPKLAYFDEYIQHACTKRSKSQTSCQNPLSLTARALAILVVLVRVKKNVLLLLLGHLI